MNDRLPIDPDKATFVILTAKDESFKISTMNMFIVKKVIDGNVGNVVICKKLASGDLLAQTCTVLQVRSLLKLRFIHNVEVEASISWIRHRLRFSRVWLTRTLWK